MDTDTQTKEERDLDMALENMPGEVQDFMWSDAFTILLDAMQKTVAITDAQKDSIRIEIYDILVGLKTMTEVAEDLLKTMEPELVAKILYIIDSEFITRAENITEFYSPDPNEETVPIPNVVISPKPITPAAPLAGLQNRLTQSNMIMPVKRDLSFDSTPSAAPSVPTKPLIDPYRELPEK